MIAVSTMDRAVASSLLLLSLAVVLIVRSRGKKNQAQLPPGPKGLPLLGNINDLPPPDKPEHLHWLKHKDLYGPISSVTVLGQNMIFIHDRKVAMELLERRSAKHSGRPHVKFGFDLVGWEGTMSSKQNNATHRLYRRYAYRQLGSKAAVGKYESVQETIIAHTLRSIKANGGINLFHNLKTQTGGFILKVLYDYNIDLTQPDPMVALADEALAQFSQAIIPGRWLVDVFPLLAYVPEWFPGADFKRTARLWRNHLMRTVNIPYEFVKQRENAGSKSMSFVSRSLAEAEADNGGSALSDEQEHAIKWTAVSLYIGGEDTSAETMGAFFLAMSMFPDVQRKAQEEIDRVVGTRRLPTWADREQLPFLNAIVDEALRWHPITPMALPHAAAEEDHINGYRIPKGAILFPMVWWFTRDPEVYHDPENFKPERYMEPYNEPSPRDVVFGFGRKICPGRVLADSSLYLTFAQVLASFNIRPATADNGEPVTNLHTFGPGLLAKSGPFKVDVAPRSEAHSVMLDQLVEKETLGESDAAYLQGMTKGM